MAAKETQNEKRMDKDEIKRLILEEGLTITDVIDMVVDINGFIGVGLITLGENLDEYCKSKIVYRTDETYRSG